MRPLLFILPILLAACTAAEPPRHVALVEESAGFAACARMTQANWPGAAYRDLRTEKLTECLAGDAARPATLPQVADRRTL